MYSFRTAFFYNLLLLLLLRQLFHRPLLYGGAFVLIWTAFKAHDLQLLTTAPGGWLSVLLGLVFIVLGNLIMIGLLIRFGALTVITGAFVVNVLWFPMTLDLDSGLSHSGLLILGGILALAGFGFHSATRRIDNGRQP